VQETLNPKRLFCSGWDMLSPSPQACTWGVPGMCPAVGWTCSVPHPRLARRVSQACFLQWVGHAQSLTPGLHVVSPRHVSCSGLDILSPSSQVCTWSVPGMCPAVGGTCSVPHPRLARGVSQACVLQWVRHAQSLTAGLHVGCPRHVSLQHFCPLLHSKSLAQI